VTDRTCSIEDCGRTHKARGWCGAHYAQWQRSGGMRQPTRGVPALRRSYAEGAVCAISGCGRPIKARSWCRRHYLRFNRHGDPLAGGPYMGRSAQERLWPMVVFGPRWDCWQWVGTKTQNGYGLFAVKADAPVRIVGAHRAVYELLIGPIPENLTIDHLCRNRACVNPWHMEVVTSRENTLRGNAPAAINARKTHCKRGHPLSGGNLYARKDRRRECRACARLRRTGVL